MGSLLLHWLQNFDTLIVFGDCENGRITLLDDLQRRFRGVIKAVRQQDYKGCKDANEILKNFGKAAVRRAVEQAEIIPLQQVSLTGRRKSSGSVFSSKDSNRDRGA